MKKLILSAGILACASAANAEITLDAQNNASYTAGKSTLSIGADGSASINGILVKKCDGASKGAKSKLGSVDCEDGFVVLKDRQGNMLSRFSSYALASDKKGNSERKLYDETLAKLGSPTSGAAVLSQKQITTVEETKTVTIEKTAPGPGYLDQPKIEAPKVNQTLYTPKLGVMAEKTPAVIKENTPYENKEDHVIANAEKEARRAPSGSAAITAPVMDMNPVIIDTQTSPAVMQTQTVTTVAAPTPSAAKAGAQPGTTVQTDTQTVAPGDDKKDQQQQ